LKISINLSVIKCYIQYMLSSNVLFCVSYDFFLAQYRQRPLFKSPDVQHLLALRHRCSTL